MNQIVVDVIRAAHVVVGDLIKIEDGSAIYVTNVIDEDKITLEGLDEMDNDINVTLNPDDHVEVSLWL